MVNADLLASLRARTNVPICASETVATRRAFREFLQADAVDAKPEYRGTATGFAYVFVKLPAFLSIFLFPVLFSAIGQANATLFTALFPLTGLLAALFILPEVYGFEQV